MRDDPKLDSVLDDDLDSPTIVMPIPLEQVCEIGNAQLTFFNVPPVTSGALQRLSTYATSSFINAISKLKSVARDGTPLGLKYVLADFGRESKLELIAKLNILDIASDIARVRDMIQYTAASQSYKHIDVILDLHVPINEASGNKVFNIIANDLKSILNLNFNSNQVIRLALPGASNELLTAIEAGGSLKKEVMNEGKEDEIVYYSLNLDGGEQ